MVLSGTPVDGVKVADVPSTLQEPATEGDSRGSGVSCDSGAEKLTWIGLVPLTLRELEPGVTEVIWRGAAGVLCAASGLAPFPVEAATDVVRNAVFPGVTSRTATPAMTTTAADTAVISADFRGRLAPRPGTRRRNQSGCDTAPSPRSLSQTLSTSKISNV